MSLCSIALCCVLLCWVTLSLWTSYELLMNFIQTSYHSYSYQISYELLPFFSDFLQASSKLLKNSKKRLREPYYVFLTKRLIHFLKASYELLMKFLQTYFDHSYVQGSLSWNLFFKNLFSSSQFQSQEVRKKIVNNLPRWFKLITIP